MMSAEALKIEPRVPIVEITGGIPVLLLCPSDYLPERDLQALRAIEAAVAAGRKVQAHRMALAFERRIGITVEDRVAAMKAASEDDAMLEGALVRAAATTVEPEKPKRRQKAMRVFAPLKEQAKADRAPTELPAAERGRSADEVKRWNRSRVALLNPNLTLSDDDKEALANGMAYVESSPKLRKEEAALSAHLDAQEQKARAQGEIVARSKSGRVNVLSRDAVKTLAQAKLLNADQLETATLLKLLYEVREVDAGAMEYGDTRGAGHNHEAYVANRYERAQATAQIGHVERAILIQCSNEPECLASFRWVIGQNRALSGRGAGRAFERNLAALLRALDVARLELIRLVQARKATTRARPDSHHI